jgi:uracil-DNA glycosylase
MKHAIFIGQAMPRNKSELHDWKSLNAWLSSIGITYKQIKKNFFYSALVDYFPGIKNGGHRIPTAFEIAKERPRLAKTLRDFDSQMVVPIGRLSIAYCLERKIEPLSYNVGKIYRLKPYGLTKNTLPVIPLPHPSGASTWHNRLENKVLLKNALKMLRKTLNS